MKTQLQDYYLSNNGWASLDHLIKNPEREGVVRSWTEAQQIGDRDGEKLAAKLLHVKRSERISIIAKLRDFANQGGTESGGEERNGEMPPTGLQ